MKRQGDEFLIILSETPLSGVEQFCERLRKRVEQMTFSQGKDSIQLTLSIGHASTTGAENLGPKDLVRRADQALYKAKHDGRNRVVGYDQDVTASDKPRELEKSAVINIFQKPRRSA